jgi:hypothetical protein
MRYIVLAMLLVAGCEGQRTVKVPTNERSGIEREWSPPEKMPTLPSKRGDGKAAH